MYPMDQSEYTNLRSAVEKLMLNDSSVTVQRDSSLALGAGWRYAHMHSPSEFKPLFDVEVNVSLSVSLRLGFLGLLHMEVFNQRLEQEYNASVIVTSPTVPYKAVLASAKLIKVRTTQNITATA